MDYWHDTMVEMNCDEASRMSLMLLAQYSPRGFEYANTIFSKLAGFRSEPVIRKSAFIATSVGNARRLLNPEGEHLYGGKGGHDHRR